MLSRSDRFVHGVGLVSPFSMVNELRREMDELLHSVGRSSWDPSPLSGELDAWPDIELSDEGARFVLRMDAPGARDRDVDVTYDRGAVTLRVARETAAPEGWVARRRERASYRAARTVTLPTDIDPEKAEATLRNGVIEVSLPKAPEAQPRRLAVRSEPAN
jgi:HSP20 family protein